MDVRDKVMEIVRAAWGAAAGVGSSAEDAELDCLDDDRDLGRCGHHAVMVHGRDRVVRCRVCSATLDPFSILLQYALGERAMRITSAAERRKLALLREQVAAETAKLAEVKDERDALLSSLRSWGGR